MSRKKSNNKERWRSIPDYDGYYEVSDSGRVRSVDRVVTCRNGMKQSRSGKVLSPGSQPRGYLNVRLCKNGIQKNCFVHQLVLLAFVGPCPPGMEVCHEDGDPSNNQRDNLRYDTPKGNHADRKRHGTEGRGSQNVRSKLNEKVVVKIRNEYVRGKVTCRQLASKYGVSRGTIDKVLRRTTWVHVGGADCSEMLANRLGKSNVKLTPIAVCKIRAAVAHGANQKELSEEFGISLWAVRDIVQGKNWKLQ